MTPAGSGTRTGTAYDALIVGGGHNGLVAAILLARAGRTVLVLERRDQVGGAAISGAPWPGVGARLSRYAYLVSLFPVALLRTLGVQVELRRRDVASYTPAGESGLLLTREAAASGDSMSRITGSSREFEAWGRFYAMLAAAGRRLFPTLMQPLRSRAQLRAMLDDELAWSALFERPLSQTLESIFSSDLVRGVVLTDATIGTFAAADDPLLRQNRCFLYHVIGNGTGAWDVPVGGMGALTDALRNAALAAGAQIRTGAEVVAIATDGVTAEVRCADGGRFQGCDLLANVAPAILSQLLGEELGGERPEGAQLKVNMLLRALPRLRDPDVSPARAFAGTFHVNEGYDQLQRAFAEAQAGEVPQLPPCEVYCHTLTDPSILSDELRAAGAHTLTLFGLHMPARLFSAAGAGIDARAGPRTGATARHEAKANALQATLRSLNSVLAEPLEDCLWLAPDGTPCLEAVTPAELESELAMPGGHIFHRDLTWPFAESEAELGRWGVETEHRNVWICGAGARRGGGVSGIPGHNAAQAVLASEGWRSRSRRASHPRRS